MHACGIRDVLSLAFNAQGHRAAVEKGTLRFFSLETGNDMTPTAELSILHASPLAVNNARTKLATIAAKLCVYDAQHFTNDSLHIGLYDMMGFERQIVLPLTLGSISSFTAGLEMEQRHVSVNASGTRLAALVSFQGSCTQEKLE